MLGTGTARPTEPKMSATRLSTQQGCAARGWGGTHLGLSFWFMHSERGHRSGRFPFGRKCNLPGYRSVAPRRALVGAPTVPDRVPTLKLTSAAMDQGSVLGLALPRKREGGRMATGDTA